MTIIIIVINTIIIIVIIIIIIINIYSMYTTVRSLGCAAVALWRHQTESF